MSIPVDHRDPVEVLGEEFLSRRRRGERPSVAEYAAAHPALAEQIEQLFPAMLALEHFKSSKLPSSGHKVQARLHGLRQLGDFRIIREIGRGGMGVVFEAEQQSLERHVAVKVFPPQALGDSRGLKRFRREARTAARLHHTNIVPVFGVGEQDGLHYYVMQRIQGVGLDTIIHELNRPPQEKPDQAAEETTRQPVDSAETTGDDVSAAVMVSELLNGKPPRFSGENGKAPKSITELGTNQARQQRIFWRSAANIGIQVAEALRYAHAQGVFHRDIKPGNLLLDAAGTVWVTDFGLATVVTQERLSNPGDVIGTLRFMAPEHLDGEHDARSDIYSLGLTLYELLTGCPAFQENNRAQLVHRVMTGVPQSPRALRREIPRDLDAIVLKAIARDPRRRYQSAGALADDLRCFVEDRPIIARRIGSGRRLWQWSRRNPAVAALSATLLLLAFLSFVIIGSKWREAVMENQRAEANLSLALDSLDQILERFASSWMAHPISLSEASESGEAGDSDIEFHIAVSDYNVTVLQDALKFYDQFAKQNATNPKLQRDTAKVHRRVGDIYERMGQYAKAEQAYLRALTILEAESIDNDAQLVAERANTLNQLGLVMYETSRYEDAQEKFHRARQLLFEPAGMNDPTCLYELARTCNNLGQVQWHRHQHREAASSHRQAIGILERLLVSHPDEVDYRLALARAYRIYYPFVAYSMQRSTPRRIRSAGIAILEDLVRDFPNVPDYQCELCQMLLTTSPNRRGSGDVSESSQQVQRATDLARELTQSHPSIPRYKALLARALKSRASQLERTHTTESEQLYGESVDLYRTLADEFMDIPAYQMFLALALQDHAESLRSLKRHADARLDLEQAVVRQQAYLALRPDSQFGKSMLARQYNELARTLRDLGAAAEAEEATQAADELRRQIAPSPRT